MGFGGQPLHALRPAGGGGGGGGGGMNIKQVLKNWVTRLVGDIMKVAGVEVAIDWVSRQEVLGKCHKCCQRQCQALEMFDCHRLHVPC